MPEISGFYGIIIRMFFKDHAPPPFHAEYGDLEGVFEINTLSLLEGKLPKKAHALVIEWQLNINRNF
ncbi:MAG: DUF4160 domain-containing protein [Flavobacteriales bacterium]|nr:DUF4160 domain-containing protein [Flavobacteriales bacterium]